MFTVFEFFSIFGTISGNLQIVLSVPIAGGIVITAKGLSIAATLDLQKNQFRQPYLRVAACELRGAYFDAKVTDLGLLTESINFKYKVGYIPGFISLPSDFSKKWLEKLAK